MSSIDPGSLNCRITLQAQTTTQDDFGSQQQTWTAIRVCWASIHTATSREVYAASGFVPQLSHIITIRYSQTQPITAGTRVSYGPRAFRVQAVSDPDEGRVMQSLLCQEE